MKIEIEEGTPLSNARNMISNVIKRNNEAIQILDDMNGWYEDIKFRKKKNGVR